MNINLIVCLDGGWLCCLALALRTFKRAIDSLKYEFSLNKIIFLIPLNLLFSVATFKELLFLVVGAAAMMGFSCRQLVVVWMRSKAVG